MDIHRINEFRLFAHGQAFDPEGYLATTPLEFDGVWHKGESGYDHPKSSGVFKFLGDGQTIPIFEQERIAIDYLTEHREPLKELAQVPGVTTFILGLHYQLKLEQGTIGFSLSFSTDLMRLSLDIGITPTYYVVLERDKDRLPDENDE